MGLQISKQYIGERLLTEIGSSVMKEKDYQWADDAYNKSPRLNVKCHLSIWLKYMANVKKKKLRVNHGRTCILK